MRIGDVKEEDGIRYELVAVFLGHRRYRNSYVAKVTDRYEEYTIAISPDWWNKK